MDVGIDLDGVVFDFVGALRHAFCGSLVPTPAYPDPQRWEMWDDWGMAKADWIAATNGAVARGLFREGWFYPGARKGLAAIKAAGHRVHLVTARDCEQAGADTSEWLLRHGVAYDSLLFSRDKTVVPVDLFIEDNVDNAIALKEAGTPVFLIHRPWNASAMETCGVPYVYTWEDFVAEVEHKTSNDPRPEPTDGPDYHAELAAWQERQGKALAAVRQFDTGAKRDTEDGKLDYEGFLSPLVLAAFAEYMHKNRQMADGSLRDSDNWQKGMPLDVYMKSEWRHHMEAWTEHRLGRQGSEEQIDALLAIIFNVQGYLHELLKDKDQ